MNTANNLVDGLLGHLKIGKAYLVRTVTDYWSGSLVAIDSNWVVLDSAAWIPDTGRFAQFAAGGDPMEVEPLPDGERVVIAIGAICAVVPYRGALPRKQK